MSENIYKNDFPFFQHNPDCVYLDSAATTQKPRQVIESISDFYAKNNAPIYRGVYSFSENATVNFEKVRAKVAANLSCSEEEIIFCKSATEAANLVANSYLLNQLDENSAIIISELEHHANFLPWIVAARKKGAEIRIWKVLNEQGEMEN